MPSIKMHGFRITTQKIAKLEHESPEIVAKAVRAGADIVADKVRDNLTSVLSGKGTGELLDSMGITPVRQYGSVINAKVGFDGYDKMGTPNMLKAAVLEYGSRRQQARPFMAPAVNATRRKAKAKMEEIVGREIDAIMK